MDEHEDQAEPDEPSKNEPAASEADPEDEPRAEPAGSIETTLDAIIVPGAASSPERGEPTRKREPVSNERLLNDMRHTIDKLEKDNATRGDLKLLSRTLRELRSSFRVFSKYRKNRKVTVFGSARTQPDEGAYQHSVMFGKIMAESGWMVLTGAGGGIMEGAHVGAGREMSMGVNIILPFEQDANYVIAGDRKLVNLKYFFTRKLLFVKEVHAIALFAGGFGTQDEGFEALTLIQTGKRDMMPIVCIDEPGGSYWKEWKQFIERQLLANGLISPADMSLFLVTENLEDAYDEIMNFYTVYDSMRYIRDRLVMRIRVEPTDEYVEQLNDEFADILSEGRIEKSATHIFEQDERHLRHLPRLKMHFNRRSIGRLRQLIDKLNKDLDPGDDFANVPSYPNQTIGR